MTIIVLLIQFIYVLSRIIVYALIGRVLFSWFSVSNPGRHKGRIEQFLHDVTEPVLNVARKLPHRAGMLDFAPIIAMFGVDFLSQLVIILLSNLL